jgi:beta-glucosidase
MIKKTSIGILLASLLFGAGATSVSNVQISLVKGYAMGFAASGDTLRYYMGRITYTFNAQGMDSVVVGVAITNQATGNALVLPEVSGDVGLVQQNNAADTLKTIYFRAELAGGFSGSYIASVTANGNMSRMRLLADSLVSQMTVTQRMHQLFNSADLNYFGADDQTLSNGKLVVGWRCSDGPNGVRWPIGPADDTLAIYGAGNPATDFPTEVALAGTFDTALLYEVGWAIGQETRANGLYCNLGPMCDLVVNPRWGRTFESMGEDPVLSGKMVAGRIQGTQSASCIASPKHFSPYLMETDRQCGIGSASLRVGVSEEAYRELFCVPFEMAVTVGGAQAIMTCYNKVRVPGFTTSDAQLLSENCDVAGANKHLVNDIIRNDWGFRGIALTDWEALQCVTGDRYAYDSIELDMSTSAGDGAGYSSIADNIASNGWDTAALNQKAANVVYGKLWAWGGALLPSDNAINPYSTSPILSSRHKAIALQAARESIVLAKNDSVGGYPLLPLDTNATFKLAVVGPDSNYGRPGGGGSSYVTPDTIISPLQGIKSILAAHANITLVNNYHTATGPNDAAVVVIGTLTGLIGGESESVDRPNLLLSASQLALVDSVTKTVPRTIVVYTGGSPSDSGSWSDAPAVVIELFGGRSQGQALAEILFGITNPSGHLSLTWPKSESDLPNNQNFGSNLNTSTDEYDVLSADSAHGYFYFEKTGKTPLFWFGHGLSYTTFAFSGITALGPSAITAGDRIDFAVTVGNTGTRSGDAVVQLYVQPAGIAAAHRPKDLRSFQRVTLAPGQTSTLTFTLGPRDFSTYYPDPATRTGQWQVNPGTYNIIAGSTSDPAELVNGNGQCAITSITVQPAP